MNEEKLAEKDAIIRELKKEVAHLAAVAAHDGTNTSIPTSATPINKNKLIPNSRRSSGKKKGGQPGHKKHTMADIEGAGVTETVGHTIAPKVQRCSCCGGELTDTGEVITKDEFDVQIRVLKRSHEYGIYRCCDCGAAVHQPVGNNLKEKKTVRKQCPGDGTFADGCRKCSS